MLRNRVLPTESRPCRPFERATPISPSGAAGIVRRFMDAMVNDEMVEAWFSDHRDALSGLSEQALADIVPWLPIIGVAANDGSMGALARHHSTD